MCMLFIKTQAATISRELNDDLWQKNPDGFGIIYAENGLLHTQKVMGTADDVWALVEQHQHREYIGHYRWRTHGDTDMENCHPYEVFGDGTPMPLYMSHNGVLSTGNAKDKTKSDTWHYINDYLRPILQTNPDLIFNEAFIKLLGGHIGHNNKFAFMDAQGRMAIVNKQVFIERDGVLFSNTYAINAVRFGLIPAPVKYPTYGKSQAYMPGWDDLPAKAAKPVNNFLRIWEDKYYAVQAVIATSPVTEQETKDAVDFIAWAKDIDKSVWSYLTVNRVVYAFRESSYTDCLDLLTALEKGLITPRGFMELLASPMRIATALTVCAMEPPVDVEPVKTVKVLTLPAPKVNRKKQRKLKMVGGLQ